MHPDRCVPPHGPDHAAAEEAAAEEAAAEAEAVAATATGAGTVNAVGGGAESEAVTAFEAVREAYEHLTRRGGAGAQSNPSHCLHTMLQAAGGAGTGADATGGGGGGGGGGGSGGGEAVGSTAGDAAENARFFKARLVATVHEYGEAGLPVDSLRRKFAQVLCCAAPAQAQAQAQAQA